jgi:glycerophosphoryl diester phosphodiesterase
MQFKRLIYANYQLLLFKKSSSQNYLNLNMFFYYLIRASILWLVWSFMLSYRLQAQVQPLPKAHAHNDYLHQKPLHDALAHGFTSVEADVHLIAGELYVVHDKPESSQGLHTLKELYLEPLRKHIKKNRGYIYKQYTSPVYLMIDIKTDAQASYNVLKKQLVGYKEMIYSAANPKGQVQIILSGNRPIEQVRNEPSSLVSIDGRPEDLPANYPVTFMPVISQNYYKIIRWNGQGNISQEEKQTLEQLVQTTHNQGKKLRLWASPEQVNVWQVLLEAGVDLINTDKLQELQSFMQGRKE